MRHAPNTIFRRALLGSASLTALLAANPALAGGPFRSLAQAIAVQNRNAAVNAAANAGGFTAARTAGLGAANLARAAQALTHFKNLAEAVGAASGGSASVTDGLSPNGLAPAAGYASNPGLWIGASTTIASAPDTAKPGQIDVTVTQTQPVAKLTWQNFSVGAHTKLSFNQSAGGVPQHAWVVINTLTDTSTNPTTILGEITAPGKVYVINRNGIAFGSGSVVNVAALVATTAAIAQSQFGTDPQGNLTFNLYGSVSGTSYLPTFTGSAPSAAVTVAPGASIETAAPTGTNGGGYVMLLGGQVSNAGVIGTPLGQTILAAGTDFALRPGYSATGNNISTTLGSEIAVTNGGTASNTGVIVADQGDITMVGHQVTQAGALLATTTVDQRGTVHLLTDNTDSTAQITLAPGSLTEILPEDNGQTALDSQRAALAALSAADNAARLTPLGAQLNDYSALPDQLAESRIQITTGGSVTIASGALAIAQGGQVAVAAAKSVSLQTGAVVDVSGTSNAVLPASINAIAVNIQPFQLRDSAGNRNGPLKSTNVFVDARQLIEIASGAYAGNVYTPGGLLEVGGYLGLVPHGIAEWSAIGGQVILQGQAPDTQPGHLSPSGSVVVAPGAEINLTGGLVTYQAGSMPQSYVEATNGQIFNINQAPGNLVYAGIYTGETLAHPRWHLTQTFVNPLLTPASLPSPQYVVGRDAGTLTIDAASVVMQGDVAAGASEGPFQTGARPTFVTDPYLLAQSVVAEGGSLLVGNYLGGAINNTTFDSTVTLGPLAASGNATLAAAANTILIDTPSVNAADFATLTVASAGTLTLDAPLAVGDGGAVTLSAHVIEDEAPITAHAGAITLTNLLPIPNTEPTVTAPGPGTIAVAPGVTLSARGVWTNAALDPLHRSGEGFINGGRITVDSTGALALAAGSTLDVGAGGAFLPGGKRLAASGGSIAITADLEPTNVAPIVHFDNVSIASRFSGYGYSGSGTLSVTVPEIRIGGSAGGVSSDYWLAAPSVLQSGFAGYVFDGFLKTSVAPGETVTVTEPVYLAAAGAADLPTGGDPGSAYTIGLLPVYLPNGGRDSFTQRPGASLALESVIDPALYNGGGGDLSIGAGASLAVDPGQSIALSAYGQISVFGTLTAHSGTISIFNTRGEQAAGAGISGAFANDLSGLSIWLDGTSRLDVSGIAVSFTDPRGLRYGAPGQGGTIALGANPTVDAASGLSTYAQIVERPGAVLDLQGSAVSVDVVAGAETGGLANPVQPQILPGNGGTLLARSYTGIALDGGLQAGGQGPGAANGELSLQLDAIPNLGGLLGLPAGVLSQDQVIVSQHPEPVLGDATLQPGMALPEASIGVAHISQDQIDAASFGSVVLAAPVAVTFDGSVDLAASRAIVLAAPAIGDTNGDVSTSVSLSAPYVSLLGPAVTPNAFTITDAISAGSLTVSADLIDIAGNFDIGALRTVTPGSAAMPGTQTFVAGAYSFANATFLSTGDIRFTSSTGTSSTLDSSGNLTFDAAQLYPTTASRYAVVAGDYLNAPDGTPKFLGTISILRQGATPPVPFSLGGTLSFAGRTITQSGVLRAPEGAIVLGDGDLAPASSGAGAKSSVFITENITLDPGSIISVSLDGATIPYGGTADGVTYSTPGFGSNATFSPSVLLQSQNIKIASGATLDLSGGGTIAGSGFVFGRGGSVDVNTSPLITSASGTVTTVSQNSVFAILPGYASAYAPVSPQDSGYTTPQIGEQITVGAGDVPGLAAGTYTLLPSYYDQLPGSYRVELATGAVPPGFANAFGNFTTLAAVRIGTANTTILSAVPTNALFTSAAGVQQLAQYDTETYSAFEQARAKTFDSPRAPLPSDAKTLAINIDQIYGAQDPLGAPQTASLDIASGTVDQLPQPGGLGGTVEITSLMPIEVVAHTGDPGIPVLAGSGTLAPVPYATLAAPQLDALGAARLVLGGTLASNPGVPQDIAIVASAPELLLLDGAVLKAGDVLLTTGVLPGSATPGLIDVANGATISTIGEPATAPGYANGFLFNSFQFGIAPVLDVSNTQDVFETNVGSIGSPGLIQVDTGATLLAGGSLDFVTGPSASVSIGQATLGARYVDLQVATINIGSAAALAAESGALPGGLALTTEALQTLLAGDPATGVPAAQQLILTAVNDVNILGDGGTLALDTGSTALVLNTPAIYGFGASSDAVSIRAKSFTWSGIASSQTLSGVSTLTVAGLPGGQIAGSETHTIGALDIAAQQIVLGYGPFSQPENQVPLGHLLAGFGTVTLTGSQSISANNQANLSVFATVPVAGQQGVGGDLVLETPLLTTASGARLAIIAGGSFALERGSFAAANTASVTTLGGEIDLTAASILLDSAIALPAGRLAVTATGTLGATSTIGTPSVTVTSTVTNGETLTTTLTTLTSAQTVSSAAITIGSDGVLDLAGRTTPIFDQKVQSPGGTILLESASGTIVSSTVTTTTMAGSATVTLGSNLANVSTTPGAPGAGNDIAIAPGARLDVSAPGAAAGAISLSALGGTVDVAGALEGSAAAGARGGSFSVIAGGFGPNTSFDGLNALLDAGGITGARRFELATGNILVDQTVTANVVQIAADGGSLEVSGTINASGSTPGSIALSAGGNLTIDGTALLDAHATGDARDSYGLNIDAENRAHVTLSATAIGPAGTPGGTLTIDPGATIDLRYSTAKPALVTTPQGVLVLNAPRVGGGNDGVQASIPGSISVLGAASIDLYAFRTYTPTDPNGTVLSLLGSQTAPAGAITLQQIAADDNQFASSLGTLGGQLAGLVAYGNNFNLAPGVLIESSSASGGNLTIAGDLNFSALRISDPAAYGRQVSAPGAADGSGEAGSIQFRASGDLTVNGSVTDGFLAPPDQTSIASGGATLSANNGWVFQGNADPLSADILLPSTASGSSSTLGTTQQFELGAGSSFSTVRPISLNYAITIAQNSTAIQPNVAIPFTVTVGSFPHAAPIPAGGWIATAPVLRNGNVLFAKGTLIPSGFVFQPGDVLAAGTVLPVALPFANTVIPAGTPLDIFTGRTITLAANTGILPVNALIPSGSTVNVEGVFGTTVAPLRSIDYRAPEAVSHSATIQGYLYPLAQLMSQGSLSWSLDFGAGANLAASDPHAVLPASIVNSDGIGVANTINQAPGSLLIEDPHYTSLRGNPFSSYPSAAFSVIRTGSGDLSFEAGGSLDQSSLFGIYTAGTQDPLPVTAAGDPNPQFNQPRQDLGNCNNGVCDLLPGGKSAAPLNALISATYQAYYPNGGGDVSLSAQGNITSDQIGQNGNGNYYNGNATSDLVGNWLWRQGSGTLGNLAGSQPSAWWVNFGTFVAPLDYSGTNQGSTFGFPIQLVGFEGIGSLGGGNVTVVAGGNVGQTTLRDNGALGVSRGEGLDLAVGSTGRVLPGATMPVLTGGGTLTLEVGGAINPLLTGAFTQIGNGPTAPSQGIVGQTGDVIDLRGNAAVSAGQIGQVTPLYTLNPNDPRPLDPFSVQNGIANGGLDLVPGDGTITITTLRDLVVAGAGDPGRIPVEGLTQSGAGTAALGIDPGFSLWTSASAIELFSAGGNVTPTTVPNAQINASGNGAVIWNAIPTDNRSLYPPTLEVTAASGNIDYGQPGLPAFTSTNPAADPTPFSLETAPSANGQVAFLAGASINANGYAVDISGANPQLLTSPFDPAVALIAQSGTITTNIRAGEGTAQSPLALFAFGPDTPTTDLHATDPQPARFYAAAGDIVNFQTGEILNFGTLDPIPQWYIAGKPVWIEAGQDIVSSGVRPSLAPTGAPEQNIVIDNAYGNASSSGNLFLNAAANQISVVSAGRDILSGYFYVGGPGLLEVDAGRNLYQASTTTGTATTLQFGDIKSLGSLIQGAPISLTNGASIAVLAGIGAGPDYAAFADLYFNPANQADLALPITAPANQGKVQQTYEAALAALLASDYGYTGDAAGALAFFQTLPAADQAVIVRAFFYDELQASGQQYNDPNSRFFHSYTRGRQAIDTLFPSHGPEPTPGVPSGYNGTITMLSGNLSIPNGGSRVTTNFDAGVATLFGGGVQVLDPGGSVVLGAAATFAGGNSGIVTYGSGDINIWSLGSVALGQSRIFTTGGGNILIWSSDGDINAGIGAKTSITFNPPLTQYDNIGGITITPPASSSGAGIATLQSLASVPAGNVSLIAPLGVIDAGEAGIRSSGNINLAAQAILNAANLTAKGSVTGVPTVPTVSLGAVQAAAGAAGAAANAAQGAMKNNESNAGELPSVVDAEVVSIGGTYDEEQKKKKPGI